MGAAFQQVDFTRMVGSKPNGETEQTEHCAGPFALGPQGLLKQPLIEGYIRAATYLTFKWSFLRI